MGKRRGKDGEETGKEEIGGIPLPSVALSLPARRGGPCKGWKGIIGHTWPLVSFSPSVVYESKLSTLLPTKKTPQLRCDVFPSFAEEGGFEPPIPREGYTGFRDQRLQPLGHPSLGTANIQKILNKEYLESLCPVAVEDFRGVAVPIVHAASEAVTEGRAVAAFAFPRP